MASKDKFNDSSARKAKAYGSNKRKLKVFFGVFLISLIVLAGFLYFVPKGRQMLYGPDGLRSAAIERDNVGGNVFADVPGTHPNAYALTYLKSKGTIKGYGDSKFRPDDLITRAEVVKLIVGALHVYPHVVRYSYCFDDVGGEWFAPYVCFAKERTWISGSGDNLFHPERNITSVEVLKIIVKAYDVEVNDAVEEGTPWFTPYIELAEQKGWSDPLDPETVFEPEAELSRAQVAELLFRVIETEFPA